MSNVATLILNIDPGCLLLKMYDTWRDHERAATRTEPKPRSRDHIEARALARASRMAFAQVLHAEHHGRFHGTTNWTFGEYLAYDFHYAWSPHRAAQSADALIERVTALDVDADTFCTWTGLPRRACECWNYDPQHKNGKRETTAGFNAYVINARWLSRRETLPPAPTEETPWTSFSRP